MQFCRDNFERKKNREKVEKSHTHVFPLLKPLHYLVIVCFQKLISGNGIFPVENKKMRTSVMSVYCDLFPFQVEQVA